MVKILAAIVTEILAAPKFYTTPQFLSILLTSQSRGRWRDRRQFSLPPSPQNLTLTDRERQSS
ncbi:hypothetical protein [Lyngbya sp. CCY1209]|uniref:hypothetical protein n=1 Tax=Lyngbya sp. CCY1209 TaxID=2886103 RepID=UPI002D1FD936|nr:hypothetical protein [Lyngbya sp. CCY1209]MEB3885986.1 hypothetical protein [Lyngbya sp. CCY1209]